MIAGRGSSIEGFPLFGLSLEEYDSLFASKLDLLSRFVTTKVGVHAPGYVAQTTPRKKLPTPCFRAMLGR